ncbi:MAG: hypothetical protein AAGK04_02115 [Planctomycetota bacterium]
MAATMNKADVKYEEKNIKNVDWNQVRALTGKSVPQVAMQTVKTLTKSNPKAYVKVGLIKKDLFLRVKDGSKHLDDIKLASNWSAPADSGGAKTESDPGVKAIIKQIKDMHAQIKGGEKAIKAHNKSIADDASEAEELLEAVQAQMTEQNRASTIARMNKTRTAAVKAQTAAQKLFDDDVMKPFSDMRSKGFLDWPDGTDVKVKKAWASDYYQAQMKPPYARAKDMLEEINTLVEEIDDAIDTAQTADREGGKAQATINKKVATLVKKMNAEWTGAADKAFLADGRGDNFNMALDNIRDFMKNKYEATKEGTGGLDGQLQQLGNIGSKLTMLDKSIKAIDRRGKALVDCAKQLEALGKEHKGNPNATAAAAEAKQKLKDFAALKKRAEKEKKAGMDLLKKGKALAKKA